MDPGVPLQSLRLGKKSLSILTASGPFASRLFNSKVKDGCPSSSLPPPNQKKKEACDTNDSTCFSPRLLFFIFKYGWVSVRIQTVHMAKSAQALAWRPWDAFLPSHVLCNQESSREIYYSTCPPPNRAVDRQGWMAGSDWSRGWEMRLWKLFRNSTSTVRFE